MQRGLSLGLFGLFGRSQELRDFDKALRAVDLHPNLVPEAVKLTAVKLIKEEDATPKPESQTYRAAAELAGAAPEEIFFTDDRPENVGAARRAGFDAVVFTTARRLAADLAVRGVEWNY